MSGGSKRTYGNAFNTPPSTPRNQKKKYTPNDVVNKVFNNEKRVQQLIMNYKINGRLSNSIFDENNGNLWTGSVNLQRMYRSLTKNQKESVIKSIRVQVKKML